MARRPKVNERAARALTQQIRGCREWSELRALFRGQKSNLNTLNLLALVKQLTQVCVCGCARVCVRV